MIERGESHHIMRGMSALWEGHKDTYAEQGRAELERYPEFSFSRLPSLLKLWLRRGQVPLVASRSLRNASVAEREGLPVCGPLFFLTPSLPYFLFIVNLGSVLIFEPNSKRHKFPVWSHQFEPLEDGMWQMGFPVFQNLNLKNISFLFQTGGGYQWHTLKRLVQTSTLEKIF